MTIPQRPAYRLSAYDAEKVEAFFTVSAQADSDLAVLYATSTGMFTSPSRGQSRQFLLARIFKRAESEDEYRVQVTASSFPPTSELREGIFELARTRRMDLPAPSYMDFFSALATHAPVRAHCHVQFRYAADAVESVLAIPSAPMAVGMAFDEIIGYKVAKRGERDERLYEVAIDVDWNHTTIIHEVIADWTIELNGNFIVDILKRASRISREFIREGSNNE